MIIIPSILVNPSEEICLLGITIDKTLSFTNHMAKVVSAGRQALGSQNTFIKNILKIGTCYENIFQQIQIPPNITNDHSIGFGEIWLYIDN
jgi:hypothetical protein